MIGDEEAVRSASKVSEGVMIVLAKAKGEKTAGPETCTHGCEKEQRWWVRGVTKSLGFGFNFRNAFLAGITALASAGTSGSVENMSNVDFCNSAIMT